MLTTEELEAFNTQARDQLAAARHDIMTRALDSIVGGQVQINRSLKDPITGDKARVDLTATVTGARWSYDDSIELVVTYVHPFTGKTVETEVGV